MKLRAVALIYPQLPGGSSWRGVGCPTRPATGPPRAEGQPPQLTPPGSCSQSGRPTHAPHGLASMEAMDPARPSLLREVGSVRTAGCGCSSGSCGGLQDAAVVLGQ